MKIYLYFIGRPKDPHANAVAEDFLTRAGRYVPCEMREIKPDRADLWAKHPTARKRIFDFCQKPIGAAA